MEEPVAAVVPLSSTQPNSHRSGWRAGASIAEIGRAHV